MTMQYSTHPTDDRLAEYAGADRDALADRELATHIGTCDRCAPIVDELSTLRLALAALPDIAPSRPLRLIPPLLEPAPRRTGALDWLRRLAAPAMAAGAGLVLVGAVGASGLVGGLASKASDTTSMQESSNGAGAPQAGGDHSPVPALSTDGEFTGRTDTPRDNGSTGSVAPTPTPSVELHVADRSSGEQPWLTLVIAGFSLFGISAVLRYSLSPRAG